MSIETMDNIKQLIIQEARIRYDDECHDGCRMGTMASKIHSVIMDLNLMLGEEIKEEQK